MFSYVGGQRQLGVQYQWLVAQRAAQVARWTHEQLPLELLTIGEVTHTVELPAEAVLAFVEDPDDPAIDELVLYGVDFRAHQESRLQYQIYKIMQTVDDNKFGSYDLPTGQMHIDEIQRGRIVKLSHDRQFRVEVQYTDRYIVFMTLRNQQRGAALESSPDYELCSHVYFTRTSNGPYLDVNFRPSIVVFDPETNHIVCRAWHVDGKLLDWKMVNDLTSGDDLESVCMLEASPDVEHHAGGVIGHKLYRYLLGDGTAVVERVTTRDLVLRATGGRSSGERTIPAGVPHFHGDTPARTFYDMHGRVFGMLWASLGETRRVSVEMPPGIDQAAPRDGLDTTPVIIDDSEVDKQPPVVFFHYNSDTDTIPAYRVEAWVDVHHQLQPAPSYAARVRTLCPEATQQRRTPAVFIFKNAGDGRPSEEWPLVTKIWMENNVPWTPDARGERFAPTEGVRSTDELFRAICETYNVERHHPNNPGSVSARQWIALIDDHPMWEPHSRPSLGLQNDTYKEQHFIEAVFYNLSALVGLVPARDALFPLDSETQLDPSPFELAVGVHSRLTEIASRLPASTRIPSEISYYEEPDNVEGPSASFDIFSRVLAAIWIDAPVTRRARVLQKRNIGSLAHLATDDRMAAEFAEDPDGRGFYNNSLLAEYWCHDPSYVPLVTGNIYNRSKRNPDEDHDTGDTDLLFSVMIYQAYRFSSDPKTYRLPGRLQVETPSGALFAERHKKAVALYSVLEQRIQRVVIPQEIEYLPFMRRNGTPGVMEHTRTCAIHINTTNGAGNMAIRTKTSLLAGLHTVSPEAIRLDDNATALVDHLCTVTVMFVNHRKRTGAAQDTYASVMMRTLDPAEWAQKRELPREAFLHAVEPFVTRASRCGRTVDFPASVWTPLKELGLRVGEFYRSPADAAPITESAHTVTRLRVNEFVDHTTRSAAEGARQFWRDPTNPTDVRNADFVSPFSSDVRVDQKLVALLSTISVAWRDELLRSGALGRADLVNATIVQ